MFAQIRASTLLLVLTVLLCCVAYPAILLVIGQTAFHDKAEGSLLYDKDGKAIGSRLIAQPFSGDGYFQPRPSAVSYNAAGSGASNWGANQYLLRERVARQLGPIVKYAGARQGQAVGPDVETWFQQDQYNGKPGIVAQWAAAHPTVAANWVKADALNGDYVTAWAGEHAVEVDHWKKGNNKTEPKPEDLSVIFFASYSPAHPGTFPVAVESALPDGKTEKKIQPVKQGVEIQGIFFDMWRQEHASAELELVPADMVMTSGSGLDPHITLKNALFQLDRVAANRAAEAKRPEAEVRKAIEDVLKAKTTAPLGGWAGVPLVNVLEVNLALDEKFPNAPAGT